MCMIVVGYLTKSIYIFSMVCFFGFAFTSLLFNYAHLLDKLEDAPDQKSIFTRANHLLSSLFIFALFISYWIADEFYSGWRVLWSITVMMLLYDKIENIHTWNFTSYFCFISSWFRQSPFKGICSNDSESDSEEKPGSFILFGPWLSVSHVFRLVRVRVCRRFSICLSS